MMKPERSEKNSSPPPPPSAPSSTPSFSSLPDEITVNYLARIPRPYYPRLSILSKSFRSLISSTQLYAARSHLRTTEECLYVCLGDPSNQSPQWFTLWVRPDDMRSTKKKEITTRQSLVPIPSSNLPCSSKSIVSVGSEVYVIGAPASTVRILDCRSHTWRNGPSMKVARKDAAAYVHDGNIYVLGGCKRGETWGEVFDTRTQTWACLPDPGTKITKKNICKIAEIDGKIIVRTDENDMYAYDPKQCKWERYEKWVAMSELVVGDVTYVFCNTIGKYELWCSEVKNLHWRDVRGLDFLEKKYMASGGSGKHQIVSCGGKLYLIWETVKRDKKKIWFAEIVVEKRNGAYGVELWGQVKWVDVVHTVPISCKLLGCLAVTV